MLFRSLASYGIKADQWGEDYLVIFDDGRVVLYWEDRKECTGGMGNSWTWERFLEQHGASEEQGYKEVAARLREFMHKSDE